MQYSDNSNPESFILGHTISALIVKENVSILEKSDKTWFLDFRVSQQLCKNKALFKDLWPMSIVFCIVGKKIIYSQEVSIVSISLLNNKSIELFNAALVSECESNLIFLGQLWDTGFTYYNKPIRMILVKRKKVVAYAKRN